MKTHLPRFSVVTPSFNQAMYLAGCLKSVKEQQPPPFEHIVIDGSSTDGSVDLLWRFSRTPGYEHLRWISEPDRGQSDALNKGFCMVRGDIVGWLNSDDKYLPGCFDHVTRAFASYPGCDILYGDFRLVDQDDRCLQLRREIAFSLFVLTYHKVLYIPTTATFFRSSVFQNSYSIDLDYDFAMDYEFFLRLAHRGFRFKHIAELLADFRWHTESKTGKAAAEQFAEHDRIVRRYSPLLSRLPSGRGSDMALRLLRSLAALRRYTEKLLRGYYFSQFKAGPISRNWNFGTKITPADHL